MPGYRFLGIGPDACIHAIGSLFKHHQSRRWNINLQFRPRQNKKSLSLSNAPILSRKMILNQEREHKPSGWRQYTSVRDTTDWAVSRIMDCPIRGFEKRFDYDQLCFVFQSDDGKTVYLPQFELARALFFHDSYLARTSLAPDALRLEFDVQLGNSGQSAQVNVIPSSGYTLKHFDDPRCRKTLSWILLDPEARRSYESIGEAQLRHGIDSGQYRRWQFRFEPPRLPAVSFHVRGQFDPQTNCLFVYEIDTIRNLRANVPEEIIFEHPKFKRPERKKGFGGVFSPAKPPGYLEIEDENSADVDTSTSVIRSAGVLIDFDKQFYTQKHTTKTKPSGYGRPDEGELGDGGCTVSTEEAIQGGESASADWSNINEVSDCGLIFENKFNCFMKMINALIQNHGCRLGHKEIRKLPQVARCKKHLLSDGKPRCIATITLRTNGKEYCLLEVDTSDADKSLSTQLLRVKNPVTWTHDMENLVLRLVKGSLTWPTPALDEICGPGGYKGIPHPQTPSTHKGVLSADSIIGWADRVFAWMGRVLG